MQLNKKSGFTLLEIIIVVIIIGVLASLALPKFFSTVEYSRGAEALTNLGVISQAVDRCLLKNGDTDATACDTFADLDVVDPGSALFNYTFENATALGVIDVVATRIGSGDEVRFARAAGQTGGWAKTGTNAFSGI